MLFTICISMLACQHLLETQSIAGAWCWTSWNLDLMTKVIWMYPMGTMNIWASTPLYLLVTDFPESQEILHIMIWSSAFHNLPQSEVSQLASWQHDTAHVRSRRVLAAENTTSPSYPPPASTRQVWWTATLPQPARPAAFCKVMHNYLLLLSFFFPPQAARLHLNSFPATQIWTLSTIVPLLYMLHRTCWTIWIFLFPSLALWNHE